MLPVNHPVIVAHRGLSALYPENTRLALQQAILTGARAVEFDVQLTADGTPVVFHDVTLDRLTGTSGNILETSLRELDTLHAGYPGRFGDQFADEPLLTLARAVELFRDHPGVTPCLEIKTESLEAHGQDICLERILRVTGQATEHMLLLSFSDSAIEALHDRGLRNTVWVLREYDASHRSRAVDLQPAVLAVNLHKLPASGEVFWPGTWQWMVYQTEDPATVQRMASLGCRYIETDNVRAVAAALPELFS